MPPPRGDRLPVVSPESRAFNVSGGAAAPDRSVESPIEFDFGRLKFGRAGAVLVAATVCDPSSGSFDGCRSSAAAAEEPGVGGGGGLVIFAVLGCLASGGGGGDLAPSVGGGGGDRSPVPAPVPVPAGDATPFRLADEG